MDAAADRDDEWAAEQAREADDQRRKAEPPPDLSAEAFLAWRSPRAVQRSPTALDNPLWHWLVRTRWDAYSANQMFKGPSSFDAGPMWCFQRFGMSETSLPDGGVVYIGGEHEDYYDPDFFIYNDVTLIEPAGGIRIRGYACEDFPPTDFHSATLADGAIIIVGALGYAEQREHAATPVFRLMLDTWTIERLHTSGDAPGWIHRHVARVSDDGRHLVIRGGEVWRGGELSMQENIDTWSLELASGRWTRLTALDWQRWTMRRIDKKPNRVWDLRQAHWHRDNAHLGLTSHWRFDDAPDFAALDQLYRPDPAVPAPEQGPAYNVFRTVIDGVVVRFTEDRFSVQAIVEGRLPAERLHGLQRHTLATLERLDASSWEIESD